jgi:hypothetical protein
MEEMKKSIESLILDNKIWKGQLNLSHTVENESKIKTLFNRFPSFVITREGNGIPGKNPSANGHYHFFNVLGDSTYKLDSFKAEIRKVFPELKREGKGGEHKYTCGYPKLTNVKQYKNHLTELDQKVLQICYICKDVTDNNQPLMKTYTIEEVKIIRDLYFNLQREQIDLKIKNDSKNNNERNSIIKTLIDKIKEANSIPGADGKSHFIMPSKDEIIETVCHSFIKNYKTMNKNVIQNICETILVILDSQYYEEYKETIKNNISINFII